MAEPAQVHQLNPTSPLYVTRKVFPADDWVLDEVANSRAVVGRGQQILWADGESLLVVGDTGHGKSTLKQNIVRANIGLIPDVLGLAARSFTNILYVAADRPNQIKHSLSRMITPINRSIWHEKVFIHDGPLDFALNEKPQLLAPFVKELSEALERPLFEAVFFDSLKDLVSAMDENGDGIQINHAFQSLCRANVQVVCGVHPRKMGTGRDKERLPTLDDVGGNKNISAGSGSVVYLGAPDNEDQGQLYHLKSPSERIEGMLLHFEKKTGDISYSGVV